MFLIYEWDAALNVDINQVGNQEWCAQVNKLLVYKKKNTDVKRFIQFTQTVMLLTLIIYVHISLLGKVFISLYV